ncbi:hypothetical protein BO94DRAFT_624090 [Aspergillus sclerotioniger CBS 115572]|uniref:Uncharacterized protein n=1 Tax=Aspergillus sclerotioniger CBS 115572 TaxID=1450535 RepID=A0A317WNB0_9EURO|nr:hypothetical protein BO94DRAFT_624090 [Aspergillus sclerotioniger CBS 115572]PWY87949.1 hypothetical protein BO94DRAFT_624090 [Aspergillus sclerotioniger CBS 115572]
MSSSRSIHPPSIASTSSAAKFFSLPIEIRYNIYEQLLVVPHPLHVFQDPGCPIEVFAPAKPYAWLALIYVNQQISAEARTILYGANRFDFQEMETVRRPPSLLESFFSCIGPVNAGFLSHICINFPDTEREAGQLGDIRLRDDGLQRLRVLQEQCTGLKTLEFLKEDQIKNELVKEVLLDINASVRSIGSLNNIVLRSYSGPVAPSVRELLQGLGWTVLMGD